MLLVLLGMEWFVVYFGQRHEVGVENEERKASPGFYPRGFAEATWMKHGLYFGWVWNLYAMLIASSKGKIHRSPHQQIRYQFLAERRTGHIDIGHYQIVEVSC